jgi:hypothetical protein
MPATAILPGFGFAVHRAAFAPQPQVHRREPARTRTLARHARHSDGAQASFAQTASDRRCAGLTTFVFQGQVRDECFSFLISSRSARSSRSSRPPSDPNRFFQRKHVLRQHL